MMITFDERRPDLFDEYQEVIISLSAYTGIRQLIQKNEDLALLTRGQRVELPNYSFDIHFQKLHKNFSPEKRGAYSWEKIPLTSTSIY